MGKIEKRYPDYFEIFNPGFIVSEISHPVLDHLDNALFKQILRFTDQIVCLINHSTMEYLYVSDNVANVVGRTQEELLRGGVRLIGGLMHPDDLKVLQAKVFPAFYRNFEMLPKEDQLKMKFSYTYRILHPAGHYMHLLQQNISLTIEQGKVILGLVVCTDISQFKRDNVVCYRTALIRETGAAMSLEQQLPERIFTPKEDKILSLTSQGLSEKQIADKLSLSLYTIKTHRKNMFKKSGVKNSAELVRYGMANLLI